MLDPYRKRILGHSIAAFVLAAIPFCLLYFIKGDYGLRGLSNAFLLSGAITGLGSLFAWIIQTGTFDVLNYGIYRFFESFRLDKMKRWESAYDYKMDRAEKRKKAKTPYWIYWIFGGVLLLASLGCLIGFYASMPK